MLYAERYECVPRVSASVSRTIFAQLEMILEHVDFRHHRFMRRAKRNRSIGSAAALVLEIALAEPGIREEIHKKLRTLMVGGGIRYKPGHDYLDRYL